MTETYTEQDYIADTEAHIGQVRVYMKGFGDRLKERALVHDASKLRDPEKEILCVNTPAFKRIVFGTDEYRAHLEKVKPALDHHYANNSHHIEHYPEGIAGMDLLDLVEMVCDWAASAKSHPDGDVIRSIHANQERFGYPDEIKSILINTVTRLNLT